MHAKLQERRVRIFTEIYETEKSYVDQLQITVNACWKPLRAPRSKTKVTAEQVAVVFGMCIYRKCCIFLNHANLRKLLK